MWSHRVGLIALLVLGGPACAASDQDTNDCWGGSDSKASDAERIDVCTRVLKSGGLDNEKRARMHYSRAEAYTRESRYLEAVPDLEEAVRLMPEGDLAPMYRSQRGFVLYMGEHYKEAIAAYDDAIAKDPNNAHLFKFRGYAHLKNNDPGRGLADLDKMVALEGDKPESYIERAIVYAERKETAKALVDFDKAIALKPDRAGSYFERGKLHDAGDNYDLAVADFTRSAELDPNDKMSYLYRAILHERFNKDAPALADYEKLLGFDPNDEFYLKRRDDLVKKMGKPAPPPATTAAAPAAPKAPEPVTPPPAKTAPPTPPPPETAPTPPPARAEASAKHKTESRPRSGRKANCTAYVPAVDVTISVPCPD